MLLGSARGPGPHKLVVHYYLPNAVGKDIPVTLYTNGQEYKGKGLGQTNTIGQLFAGMTELRAWSDISCLTLSKRSWKKFLKSLFWKSQQTTKNIQNYPACKELNNATYVNGICITLIEFFVESLSLNCLNFFTCLVYANKESFVETEFMCWLVWAFPGGLW